MNRFVNRLDLQSDVNNVSWGQLGFAVVVIAFVMFIVITFLSMYNYRSDINSIIAECEVDLPRNQNCKLIAVPENDINL